MAIDRDPFVSPRSLVPPSSSKAAAGVVGMVVHQGQAMGFSVPNDGLPIVRAIVSGAQSSALVEDAGVPRVVQRGDSLSGSRIDRIDAGGILLEDGRELMLAGDRQ
ncbi:MAG: hypothetical protein JO165_05215 [Candidatus Eremiobacteraeota bacterium]|nr:hypothetical protein [Candidatus Eremiobacteraeota bacterium]